MTRALAIAAVLLVAPASAQIVSPLNQSTTAQVSQASQDASDALAAAQTAQATANSAAIAASSAVKTVNGVTPSAGNIILAVPVAATAAPPGVSDSGSAGTSTGFYAMANHTHASKARKGRVLVPSTQTLAVTFRDAGGNNAPFSGIPVCAVTAEATAGDTNVVNAQIDGSPTATGMTIRITRTAVTAASLLGINVLSVPAQIATYAHYICIEP